MTYYASTDSLHQIVLIMDKWGATVFEYTPEDFKEQFGFTVITEMPINSAAQKRFFK